MKELFYELIKETCNGKVIIDNEEWPYSFNTIIEDKIRLENKDNNVCLIIKNEEEFFKLLEEYINLELSTNRKTLRINNEKDKIKFLIVCLFANATTEDFINPENLIRRNISFLKDNTFDYLDKGIEAEVSSVLKDSKIEIKREQNSTMMETPHKITFSFKNNDSIHKLPSIYYGIVEENGIKKCYIYSIQAPKNENNKYNKTINRLLFKINDGVEDSKEYYDYKEGLSNYYPEGNISDVTMSFVLSLNLFITLLQSENIKEIKAVPYLPVRYNSRALSAKRNDNEENMNRNINIQKNLTEKFIRTFRRLESQNSGIKISTYPYELDEFLTIEVNNSKNIANKLLDETSKDIEKCKPKTF